MEDRVVDLEGIPSRRISEAGYDWYLHEEYIIPEAVYLEGDEIDAYREAADKCYQFYLDVVDDIIEKANWDDFGFPIAMREMIQHSYDNEHMHLFGRFDFGGGIDGIPLGLLEFNADTCTMLPESAFFQDFFREEFFQPDWFQFNFLHRDLVQSFKQLIKENPDRDKTIVVTSLGYVEDKLNAKVIVDAAKEAGFEAVYADLEFLIFEDDGVYLEFDGGEEIRFDFMYKLVPWEFIMFEEPELLEILKDLQLNDEIYILNPAHSILMQSKAVLPYLYKKFNQEALILKASFDKGDFDQDSYVEKVTFGRLGENISIYDPKGELLESTGGDFGEFPKIYQKFTPLYKDEEGNYYQAGVYVCDGKASSLSFRRCEGMIVNDDAEYIPHFMPRKR